MSLEQEYEQQEIIIQWLNDNLACHYSLKTRNVQLAHSCFDLAIEHHAAIYLLCKSGLYGSMFSLLRVVFETVVNGLWLNHVADENQVSKYENDDIQLGFGAKINMIENRLGISESALKSIKKNHWKIFNSFTHGGFQSLVRRINETHTGSANYDDDEKTSGLRLAGQLAFLSGIELAAMTGNQTLIKESLSIYKSHCY
jgi:hypothetical protein